MNEPQRYSYDSIDLVECVSVLFAEETHTSRWYTLNLIGIRTYHNRTNTFNVVELTRHDTHPEWDYILNKLHRKKYVDAIIFMWFPWILSSNVEWTQVNILYCIIWCSRHILHSLYDRNNDTMWFSSKQWTHCSARKCNIKIQQWHLYYICDCCNKILYLIMFLNELIEPQHVYSG
jgi:hypothetical protein